MIQNYYCYCSITLKTKATVQSKDVIIESLNVNQYVLRAPFHHIHVLNCIITIIIITIITLKIAANLFGMPN